MTMYAVLKEKVLALPLPRVLSWQLLRYGFVSVVSALVDVTTVYLVLQVRVVHYTVAVAAGFIAGTMANFLLSNRYVFLRNASWMRTCVKHYMSSMSGFVINMLVVVLLVEYASFTVMPAKLVALVLGFLANFFAIKYFAFADRRIN